MTAGRGMARRSLFTTGPSASTISALRSITSLRARRTGTMVSGSNEALSARRSEEHTSELQSQSNLVCRLLLEKKKKKKAKYTRVNQQYNQNLQDKARRKH